MVKKNEATQDNILVDISDNEEQNEIKNKMSKNILPISNEEFISDLKTFAKNKIIDDIKEGKYKDFNFLKAELHRKITCVKYEMQGILETGDNQSQKFKYITYKMAEAYLSKAQHKYGVNFFLKEISSYQIIEGVKSYYQPTNKMGEPVGEMIDKTGQEVIMTAVFCVVDCETGYEEEIKMIDSAYRQNGTSSLDKIITFLQKRCEFKIFNVTSSEASEDDPEGQERNIDKEYNDKKYPGKPIPKNEVTKAKETINNYKQENKPEQKVEVKEMPKEITVPKKTFFELLKIEFPHEGNQFLKTLVKKALNIESTLGIKESDYDEFLQKCKDNAEELRDELR